MSAHRIDTNWLRDEAFMQAFLSWLKADVAYYRYAERDFADDARLAKLEEASAHALADVRGRAAELSASDEAKAGISAADFPAQLGRLAHAMARHAGTDVPNVGTDEAHRAVDAFWRGPTWLTFCDEWGRSASGA